MSEIKDFYREKSIFITGGSGFIGKVLIEKLLYSCSDLKEIFFLIRAKNEEKVEDRLNKILNLSIFERIKSEKPEVLKKIIPIEGDIAEENLGISDENLKIISVTNIIFNIAASVTFEDTVKEAYKRNTKSFIYIIEMAKKMKNLQVLMQCSTGYCFPHVPLIEEKIYDLNFDFEFTENVEKYLKIAEKNSLYGHPSTYSFTKRLAEKIANDEFKNLPICVVRPTIGNENDNLLVHCYCS